MRLLGFFFTLSQSVSFFAMQLISVRDHLDSTRLLALCGPNEVAIGFAIAFLALHRLRYKEEFSKLGANISSFLPKRTKFVEYIKVGRLTDTEKDLLAILQCFDHQDVKEIFQEAGSYGLSQNCKSKNILLILYLWWFRNLILTEIDRFVVSFGLFFLVLVEIYISYYAYMNSAVELFFSQWPFQFFIFILHAVMLILPILSLMSGESVLKNFDKYAQKSQKNLAIHEMEKVEGAVIS